MTPNFKSLRSVALLTGLIAMPMSAGADVTAISEHGFSLSHEVTTSLDSAAAYELLATPSAWWDMDHSYTGEAANLSLDARAGGCFCETLDDGGSVEHLRVVYAQPGVSLRLSGGLGPLQALGVAGAMTWTVEATDDGSTVRFDYTVGGFIDGDFGDWAPAVDGVVSGQLDRFRKVSENAH